MQSTPPSGSSHKPVQLVLYTFLRMLDISLQWAGICKQPAVEPDWSAMAICPLRVYAAAITFWLTSHGYRGRVMLTRRFVVFFLLLLTQSICPLCSRHWQVMQCFALLERRRILVSEVVLNSKKRPRCSRQSVVMTCLFSIAHDISHYQCGQPMPDAVWKIDMMQHHDAAELAVEEFGTEEEESIKVENCFTHHNHD